MSTRLTGGRQVHFGGNCVRISSDSPAIFNTLAAHFRHCSAETGRVIAQYHITAITETCFSISVDGSVFYPELTFEQVLWSLMQDGITRLNGTCVTDPIFHAAALENAGSGVILCGQSGSGKSSLAAWLLTSGFRYLTDEVITYAVESGQISGLARSLILKRGSAFIWQHWLGEAERDGFLRFTDGSAWIDPLLLNVDGICTQTTPRLLFFPHYTPDTSFRVTKLSPAEALFRLLQTLVNARNLADTGMKAAACLVRRVTAYSLDYSDIESATAWIKQA